MKVVESSKFTSVQRPINTQKSYIVVGCLSNWLRPEDPNNQGPTSPPIPTAATVDISSFFLPLPGLPPPRLHARATRAVCWTAVATGDCERKSDVGDSVTG